MSPGKLSARVVTDRLAWVEEMLAGIRALPLEDRAAFLADQRNPWAAESCLRRALEALLDLGRHILARGFGQGATEYKEIASGLAEHGVLGPADADRLRVLAGYRNRLVHFYHEVRDAELYEICAFQLADLESIVSVYRRWLHTHPEMVDPSL